MIKVNESWREIYFTDGSKLTLKNVTEIDNSGSWLRIIAGEHYYLLNPNLIRYHKMLAKEKVF